MLVSPRHRGIGMKGRGLNRILAKDNPERVFSKPEDIVQELRLTRGEKLATLNRWRQSLLHELGASSEGMRTFGVSADRIHLLEQIEEARTRLAMPVSDPC